jgi:SAM-dependent methyltransferase
MAEMEREDGRRAFGGDPSGYDTARPGYPEPIYDNLRSRCGLARGTATFEIGPGTGKATSRLLQLGAAPLIAIEPDARLAAFLNERYGDVPGLTVLCSAFEDVALADGSFDLGVAATSFHWLERAASLRKIARLLRPGGWWAMWWYVFGDPERPDAFHEATQEILAPLGRSPANGPRGGTPFALETDTRIAELKEVGEFVDISNEVIRLTVTLGTAEMRALFATFSEFTRLPPARRNQVLDALADVADRQFGGEVEKPIVIAIYTARRR